MGAGPLSGPFDRNGTVPASARGRSGVFERGRFRRQSGRGETIGGAGIETLLMSKMGRPQRPGSQPDDPLRASGATADRRDRRALRSDMAQTFTGRKRVRKVFGHVKEVGEMPNLIEVQKASYDQFLLDGPAEGRPSERGPAGGVQVGVSDHRFRRHRAARVRQIRIRGAEIRRRRVPPARHDLRRAAQGDAAPHRVRRRSRDAGQVGQGHQGAGRLHGRHAAHDGRTAPSSSTAPSASSSRRCTAAPACSSITTRARAIPRASCCSPRASFPIAARGSTSSSTPRTSSMRASTGAARFR